MRSKKKNTSPYRFTFKFRGQICKIRFQILRTETRTLKMQI
ncbi:hypothetical protein CAMRE0001_1269 [Campylobacter rectus RM3267]|uniref:Uncharacterized protein n=1 Tax=Campylobacter rectus RM3267 TaxID=553218 RepID=B9D0Q9_CAMRE|nr:hypothetical protein CAMRE0001_1269 [Campylobacter rectus RM3267]